MDTKTAIGRWMSEKRLDPALRRELENMDDKALEDAFRTDLGFGTGGLRGRLGVGTARLNIHTVRRAALGFGRYLKSTGHTGGVVISYDNRHESRRFAFASAAVMGTLGIPAKVFDALRPTPMLSFAVRHFNAAGGIMITASHNPKTDNGFKAYNHTGAQLDLDEAAAVTRMIDAIGDPFQIDPGLEDGIETIGEDFDRIYYDAIRTIGLNDVDKSVHIVYSPLHGTGGSVIPKFMKDLGYRIEAYAPEMIPDPDFSHVRSSNPEDPRSFEHTIRYAEEVGADLVLVTDPDADRLGVAVRTKDGFVLLNGNETASLILEYILSSRKKQSALPDDGIVYTTVVTTPLIETIASSYGVRTQQTLTGFKFIGALAEANKDSSTFLFGCEESYGSLISDVVRDKDAVQAVIMLSELACHLASKGENLVDYLDDIGLRHGGHAEDTRSITLQGSAGLKAIHDIMDHVRGSAPHLNGKSPLVTYDYLKGTVTEDTTSGPTGLPVSDVMKFLYAEGTWVVFRPSGTEPKLKIYVGTTAPTRQEAKAKATSIADLLVTLAQTIKGE
jgi:phosphoglucomutase